MDWSTGSADRSITLGSDMVGVNLDPYCSKLGGVYVRKRAKGCDGLREGNRRAPVEEAEGLPCTIVNGHRSDDPSGCQFSYFDAQRVLKSAAAECVKPGQPILWFGHAVSYHACPERAATRAGVWLGCR